MKNIYLQIAGMVIKLKFKPSRIVYPQQRIKSELLKNYRNFMIDRSKRPDFVIEYLWNDHPETLTKKNDRRVYMDIGIRKANENKLILFYQSSESQFELILRDVLIDLLIKNKGLALHASAVLINNKAQVFLAKSGGGKTTIANLLSNAQQKLAEDIIFIKKIREDYFFYQTPFHEGNDLIKKTNKRFKIGSFFFLRKSKRIKRELIKNKQRILTILLKQVLFRANDQLIKSTIVVNEIVQKYNFFNLFFTKDEEKINNFLTNL